MMRIKKIIAFMVALGMVAIGSGNTLMAQTPVTNQAAVDTLTKNVAIAVFRYQAATKAKAAQIVDQLSGCADSCDAVAIINRVGSWDLVAAKMEELGRLKNNAQFQTLSSGDANAAVRGALHQFYEKYKADKNYGIPLNVNAQAQILDRIDQILPPNPESESPVANSLTDNQRQDAGGITTNPDSTAIRISRLERAVNEGKNSIWMILLYALLGLLAGAGIVYFGLYRALRKEVDRLTEENTKLSRSIDLARRTKATNEPRQPQNWKQPSTDVPQKPEPDKASFPTTAEQPENPVTPPIVGSGVNTWDQNGPIAEPIPVQSEPPPTVSVASLPRSEVFYFPPPDPNGQFDTAQRADMLSPESAYRFSTTVETPTVAAFRFEAEPGRLARLLTYRNYMVEPACDSENSYTSQFTRIVNRRDGQAVLENGTWRVKTKSLIRYE